MNYNEDRGIVGKKTPKESLIAIVSFRYSS